MAHLQAEKRRAQGYAPQQPGAPGSPTRYGWLRSDVIDTQQTADDCVIHVFAAAALMQLCIPSEALLKLHLHLCSRYRKAELRPTAERLNLLLTLIEQHY